jgi:hypothetical protein
MIKPNSLLKDHEKYEIFKFSKTCTVSLESIGNNERIYYTLSGSTPDETSQLYTKPFTLTKSTTVKVVAVKEGMLASDIRSIKYIRKSSK